ncbi:MAG: GNAT family N-acetyltransferase [Candidatus Eisenbacteria bacterium]|nr:GNAT family N-acetyltransferase [Candidatus Eisenbacteria bacterium]
MSLHHSTGAVTLDRLGPGDLLEVFGYLDRDPVVNVYLLALALRDGLARPRDEFWAVRRDGELVGLLCLGGQSGAVLPLGDDAAALRLLADQAAARLAFLPRRFQVIGPREAVAAVVERLDARGLAPRVRRAQLYMAVPRGSLAPGERLPELRPARPEDYDLVFHSGAGLRAEELEEDPRAVDPLAYARRVEEECRDGYTWLWVADGALRFRASVSALTSDAVQISGVYTPPALRNRGHATRALTELCTRLFHRAGAACLFVNDFNAPALAVYRRLGFEDRAAWASAFYEAPRP